MIFWRGHCKLRGHFLRVFMKFLLLLLLVVQLEAFRDLSFEDSMKNSKGYDPTYAEVDKGWQLIKETYNAYKKDFVWNPDYLIPKNIHIIWLGSPLPDDCRKKVETWKRFHPDWKVRVWTDRDLDWFNLVNDEAYDRSSNYGEKSDIFRYEILYRYGGLYVDTDFECVKPFDDLHKSCEFYTSVAYDKVPVLYNGLIGTRAGHPIIKACMDNIKTGNGDWDAYRIMEMTGPYYFTRQLLNAVASEGYKGVVVFPVTVFYPYPSVIEGKTDAEIKHDFLKPESMALHYWHISWLK